MVRNKSTPTQAKPKFGETSDLMVLFRLEKAREKKTGVFWLMVVLRVLLRLIFVVVVGGVFSVVNVCKSYLIRNLPFWYPFRGKQKRNV